jgi:CBS domain-containing protein/sporulation protein YlmC with PRC-barrel domain
MNTAVQQEALKMFVFFSDILNRRVIDSEGKIIGKVVDLRVKLGEIFPAVVSVRVRQKRGEKFVLFPWDAVESINGRVISLKPGAENQTMGKTLDSTDPSKTKGEEILLKDEILDKQVVDTFGAKIERVNDLHLLLAEGQLRVVHVDFGIRGIFRRMGWVRYVDVLTNWLFAYQVPNKLLSWKFIQPLSHDPYKHALKLNVTHRTLSDIHPSDLADILEELDRHRRSYVFGALDVEAQANTLEEVDDQTRVSLIESLPQERASDVIEEMEPDEAADLLSDLSEEKKRGLIEGLEEEKREELEELLTFEEGTTGSIMTPNYISCLLTDNVDKPLDSIAYIYVVDDKEKLVGVVTLRDLILHSPETQISSFMNKNIIKLKVDESVKEAAEIFKKYKFLAIPIVDDRELMKGIITLSDGVESIFPEFGE